jgi:hypothetical protein
MDDFQSWLSREVNAIREDCGETRVSVGRMDERMRVLERAETERKTREQSIADALARTGAFPPEPPASSRTSAVRAGAVNISTAGLGGAAVWIMQKLFGG